MFSKEEQRKLENFWNQIDTCSDNNQSEITIVRASFKAKPVLKSSIKMGRTRKAPHELLSKDQKKANHIVSEQKRRANIRSGFEQLVSNVPTLENMYQSEALILQTSVNYIRDLVNDKKELKEQLRALQSTLGEKPDGDSSGEETSHF